jgi:hypothetical protein
MKHKHLLIFASLVIIIWGIGTPIYIYFFPRLLYNSLDKIITEQGLGNGSGIPVNTLYAVPTLASPSTTKSSVLIDGTNHDTLYDIGLLDLSKGPQVLHVPDMDGRYYSIEFVDPADGTVFSYVGRRTTGTQAGNYFITGPGQGSLALPAGMTPISSPDNNVLIIGRVLVESDNDLPTAYDLEKQIQLTPLN